MTAARTGNVDAVKLLIARGADVNAREQWFGETALMWAAAENHADAVRALAEAGADVNARSTRRSTRRCSSSRAAADRTRRSRAAAGRALMFAAREGAIDAARALAELGAELNVVGAPADRRPAEARGARERGQGHRHDARWSSRSSTSHYDLAAVLLEKGADPNVVDIAGMGALYAAVDMNSLQWVQGRPAPILHRQARWRGPGEAAARQGRESERAPEAARRSSAITTPARR